VLDPFGGDQLISHPLDCGGLAPRHQDFEAIIVVDVHMHRGHDETRMIVLKSGQQMNAHYTDHEIETLRSAIGKLWTVRS
jgi:hypothetical protein